MVACCTEFNLFTPICFVLSMIMDLPYTMSTGRGSNTPLRSFSSITQKREKVFSSNLLTFFIKKWMTICTIKLEDKPLHVAMAMAQIKEFNNYILKKSSHFRLQKWNQQLLILVTLPNFEKFHPQTTEMKHFEIECFSMKTLKF